MGKKTVFLYFGTVLRLLEVTRPVLWGFQSMVPPLAMYCLLLGCRALICGMVSFMGRFSDHKAGYLLGQITLVVGILLSMPTNVPPQALSCKETK